MAAQTAIITRSEFKGICVDILIQTKLIFSYATVAVGGASGSELILMDFFAIPSDAESKSVIVLRLMSPTEESDLIQLHLSLILIQVVIDFHSFRFAIFRQRNAMSCLHHGEHFLQDFPRFSSFIRFVEV